MLHQRARAGDQQVRHGRRRAAGEGGQLTAAPPILLEADRVAVTYASSRGPVAALANLSATLRAGEFLSVLGPSGCGKSTLLKVVSGLLRPSSGAVRLNGAPIEGPRADVGIVFQQPTLLPWANVLDNVLLPIRTLKRDLEAGRRRAAELLRLVGLERFQAHYPHELSVGMQQRVSIARGLIHDPALLLMDEPFSALDAMTREHMMVELQRIWQATGKSVVFVTHSIAEAVFLSDRIVVLTARPGTTVQDVTVDLPRPRTIAETMGAPRFTELTRQLHETFAKLVVFE